MLFIYHISILFVLLFFFSFFFFNDTATTEIYTLSLHDALPISRMGRCACGRSPVAKSGIVSPATRPAYMGSPSRSEEHTSELQSHSDLVCRLLLEKKKKKKTENQKNIIIKKAQMNQITTTTVHQ